MLKGKTSPRRKGRCWKKKQKKVINRVIEETIKETMIENLHRLEQWINDSLKKNKLFFIERRS